MPYTRLSEMLKDAREKGYGVPSYNLADDMMMQAAVDAAEHEGMPVILMFHHSMRRAISFEVYCAIARSLADRAKVPVGIHLDHCGDPDVIYKAIKAGFGSVMYDGSKLSIEENITNTAEIAKVVHSMDIDIEGEIGHVGMGKNVSDFKDSSKYTKSEELQRYIEQSGVDACAVAIGNSHGAYVEQPELNIDLLKELNTISGVPLVLHGSSGIPDSQMQEAVVNGMTKTNIATELFNAVLSATRETYGKEEAHPIASKCEIQDTVREYLIKKQRLLNPRGIRVV